MCPASSERVSELLFNWGHGDQSAREELIPLVYVELRRIARRYLWKERPDHTLQSGALVHEAYLHLLHEEPPQWQNRAHFFGFAAQLMRHILVDHARGRLAAKRGAGAPRLALDPEIALPQKREVDLVALDDALTKLATLDPQQSRLIELRFFGGLSIEETAVVLGISPATVKREWATARAWLQREMKQKEVESLIATHEEGDIGFLKQSAMESGPLGCGAMLGSYEILAPLGSGGMGDVYRARDTHLNREVAVKVLSPNFEDDPNLLMRFRREAHVLASLNHPNIVTIYDVGQDRHTVYIAMELVDGKVLDEILAAGAMPTRDVLDIGKQIGAGLAVAHESGIVHRDLKPKNVMIRKDGLAKILDFGLSKLAPGFPPSASDGTTAATEQGVLLGTIDYMSPEQASGLPTDFRSDQFSFGSLLYEMVTGKRPFHRETGAQTLAAIIEDEPKPIAHLNPNVPAALENIVHRCMAKKPEKRYTSTQELARALKKIRDSTATEETRSLPAIARTYFHRLPLWFEITLAAALVVAGISIVAPRLLEKVDRKSV